MKFKIGDTVGVEIIGKITEAYRYNDKIRYVITSDNGLARADEDSLYPMVTPEAINGQK